MKSGLKRFQEKAVRDLLKLLSVSRGAVAQGLPQTIVLSSPTGSGKTVTITALMEQIFEGHDGRPGDPDAVFLWVSDSPELNEQSRQRILEHTSVFKKHQLVMVDPSFDQERFSSGRIYFLNTQKLGRNSLLTIPGDRQFTIWETIQNSAQAKPDGFYLILDEAHRGMQTSAQAKQAESLVQRFILGAPDVGLDPVMLIIGMSATPGRFMELMQFTTRGLQPCVIDPAEVRKSGLLKDRIVLHCPERRQESDWTLLELAAKKLNDFDKRWGRACKEQGLPDRVMPALVVQVEDGTDNVLTRTDLENVVVVLERGLGKLADGEIVHCFQEDKTVEARGYHIRKMAPSSIQREDHV